MLFTTSPRQALKALLRRVAFHPLYLVSMLSLFVAWPVAAASAAVGPTVKEVIEMTRLIQPVMHDDETLQNQVSPDRDQAFIVTRTADVATDTNRFEILWFDVSRKRLAGDSSGVATAAPVSLLTVEARQDDYDGNPPLQDVRWVDNRTLVFRARMNDEPFQVYKFDVLTRRMAQLTFSPSGVIAFDASSDLQRVVYVTPVSSPAVPPGARSVVVGTNSFWNVHFGQGGLRNQQRHYQYFVAAAGLRVPARPLGESFAEGDLRAPTVSVSPDGRWAVLPKFEPGREQAWAKQYPQVADFMAQWGSAQTYDPLSYYSRPLTYVTRREVLYRLSDGQEQTIVDAPDDAYQGTAQRSDRLWQDGGKSVVIAGTYLPRHGGDSDTASHIIEYWPDAGKWKDIAVLKARLKFAQAVAGQSGAFDAMDGEQRRHFERSSDGTWHELTESRAKEAHQDALAGISSSTWHLHVQEALNQPPDIVAQGSGGATVRLTELNPQFSASSWGTMREYNWTDATGKSWNGGLMVPADFNPHVRHALVIQTYGFTPTRFYRDGSNIYDGFTSGFPGRAFLRENILVLALPIASTSGLPADQHGQITAINDGVRAAIDSLVAAGWVDRDKVGIMAWSSTGERVLNLITFTDTPIRAASLLDGDANTLFSMTITYSVVDFMQARKEQANGGGPYGESLQRWIQNDPSLHTDCIRAALRIETYGPEVHNNWDIYALLRRQYKPVEMIYMPEGAHALSRPSERMISLQGNVDWYRFWLNDEKRAEVVIPAETAISLKDQYVRWEQMKVLKQAADAKPACDVAAKLQ